MEDKIDPLSDLLAMWDKDAIIDRIEPGNALLEIPKLHSKYLRILSNNRMKAKKAEFNYYKVKKIKREYYTGKLDEETLKKYGWEPFQFVLNKDISIYLESDEDLMKALGSKELHDEIVKNCEAIMKELHSRTYQIKEFITWERFINGA